MRSDPAVDGGLGQVVVPLFVEDEPELRTAEERKRICEAYFAAEAELARRGTSEGMALSELWALWEWRPRLAAARIDARTFTLTR